MLSRSPRLATTAARPLNTSLLCNYVTLDNKRSAHVKSWLKRSKQTNKKEPKTIWQPCKPRFVTVFLCSFKHHACAVHIYNANTNVQYIILGQYERKKKKKEIKVKCTLHAHATIYTHTQHYCAITQKCNSGSMSLCSSWCYLRGQLQGQVAYTATLTTTWISRNRTVCYTAYPNVIITICTRNNAARLRMGQQCKNKVS